MRSLNVVVDGLAQVVQKTGALGGHNIQTKLGAITPHRSETSSECCRTFWPNEVR